MSVVLRAYKQATTNGNNIMNLLQVTAILNHKDVKNDKKLLAFYTRSQHRLVALLNNKLNTSHTCKQLIDFANSQNAQLTAYRLS